MNPEATAALAGVLSGLGLFLALDRFPTRAPGGRGRLLVERFRVLVAGRHGGLLAAIAAFLAAGALAGPVPAAGVALLARVLVALARRWRRGRRARERAASVPSILRALAEAVAVGVPLDRAAAEASFSRSPAAREMAAFAAARTRGASLDEALLVLTADDPEGCWTEAAAAISLQRRCGGDLAAPLRGIAAELEAMEEGRRDATAAMSQARFTASLVCSLPIIVCCGIELLRPGAAASVAASPPATALAVAALGLQAGSMAVISRIAASVAR